MVQQPGGDVKNCLEEVKGKGKKSEAKYGKIFFPHWFSFHNANKLEKRYSSMAKGLQHDSRSKIIDTKK